MQQLTETPKRKATKRLKNFDFSGEGASVSLVGPSQGGAANGFEVLTIKANKFTDEHVDKASKIRVTMDIEEFLRRFYGLYSEDSEILARALGFDTAAEDMDEDSAPMTYEDYITSKVEAIEVLKSLYESENIIETLSSLDPDSYIAMLQSQAVIEKAFKKLDKEQKTEKATKPAALQKESKPAAQKAKVEDTSIASEVKEKKEVSASVEKQANKENVMTQEVKTVEQEVTVEMVEKSAFDSIQKSLDEQKVALQKAMDTIAQFEAKEKAAIEKARKAEMLDAVKDEAKAEVLFKAVKNAEDADFQAVIKALQDMTAVVEKSDLFVEKGASGEAEVKKEESAVERLLKSKYAKQAK